MEGTQLGFDIVTTRLVKVTPARLATWRDCRRRYRFGYLDRPTPPRGGARAASTLGAVVHLALRALYDLPAARRTPDAAAAMVDRHWSQEGFRDAAQARLHRERARDWVAAYAADAREGEPVAVETWVSASTDRIVVGGRVDRIDLRDGELVVVDYKTGRRPLTTVDARDSEALALYAVGTQASLRRPCTRVELHHLPTGEVLGFSHDRASLRTRLRRAEDAAAELAEATETLAAGGDPEALFPPRPAPRCGTCDMRRHCPEGRAAAPEEPPWSQLAE